MKILHLIDALDYGGAETLLMSYLPLLTEHEHFVATLSGPNVYPTVGYEYIQLDVKPIKGFFKARKAIRKIIKENKIDIVHAHSFWTNIISRTATPSNIKLFNHYHFADYDTGKNKVSIKRMILLDKFVSHNNIHRIAVSEYVGQILSRTFPRKRLTVIPNFINCSPAIELHKKNDTGVLKIIAVGNCNLEKNYELVFSVFEELKDEPISIDIIGGGDKLEDYRNEVTRLGLKKVRFLGYEANVKSKLKEYDLYLSTSVSETFGISVLEAVCAKMPMLLSDIPAFREIAPITTVFFDPLNKDELVGILKEGWNYAKKIGDTEYGRILEKYSSNQFVIKLRELYTQS